MAITRNHHHSVKKAKSLLTKNTKTKSSNAARAGTHEKIVTRPGNSKHPLKEKTTNDLSALTADSAPFYDFSSVRDHHRFVSALQQSNKYAVEFVLQKNSAMGDLAFLEQELLIAPVTLLQKNSSSQKFLGVFAKNDLKSHVELCLGEYIGETKDSDELDKDKRFDSDYAFDLGNGTTIDAKYRRGWPAFVNATSSYESSNVFAKSVNGRIYYHLIKPIKKGEQLLIYYGDDYTFKDKRFLNPSDNWEESHDKYIKYQDFYKSKKQLDPALINLLQLDADKFAIPDKTRIQHCAQINIPILAYKKGTNDFLPQNQQENITSLMLACWHGNTELAQHLLDFGANPNQQTSIHGYSVLHLITLSPHLSLLQKTDLIDRILSSSGIKLRLQDLNDDSIIHHAVRTNQIELTEYILRKDKELTKHRSSASILDCVNSDNMDVFSLAMISDNPEMINIVMPYMRLNDLDEFLDDHEDLDHAFSLFIKSHTLQEVRARIALITKNLNFDKTDQFKLSRVLHRLIPKTPTTQQTEKQSNSLSTKKRSRNNAFFPDNRENMEESKGNEQPKFKRKTNS